MTRYAYRYPDGVAGLAVLLLRVASALVALAVAASISASPVSANLPCLVAALGALGLILGFATRWIALLLGIAVIVAAVGTQLPQQLLLLGHLGGCAALALMGPGAYSIDARRHGRRVIQLQPRTPDRGDKD
jgi:uncharacterized membrane protein YphA (DoxX/SURF4 family)